MTYFTRLSVVFALLAVFAYQATAQGTIRGTVTDESIGEAMMFTNVLVKDTDPPIGAQTDLDGNYEISITPGTYTLEVSYIGYSTNTITDVVVKEGEVTVVDFLMKEESQTLDLNVVVKAEAVKRTENALLTLRKKAVAVQDNMSAQEISRFGSSNAADAARRVTGVSVVDGRYVYVRGLGDRYTNAQLNGQQLPSTDPYRNSIQMDLIPANILDNIIASKTFTPDMPGNITGGNVNFNTKSFPERFTLAASLSATYNTQSSFIDNFLTQEGGSLAGLGYDDGFHELPEAFRQEYNYQDEQVLYTDLVTTSSRIRARRDDDLANILDEGANALNRQRVPSTKSVPFNQSASFSIGNQFMLGDNPLGVLLALNYRKNYRQYTDGTFAYYELTDPDSGLNIDRDLTDNRATERTTLGTMLNLSYKFGGANKISFIGLYNHIGGNDVRELSGPFPAIISGNGIFQTRALRFQERTLLDYQLTGEHVLNDNGLKLEWGGSLVNVGQEDPDFRQFSNTYSIEDGGVDTTFFISPAEFDLPFHFFRTLKDQQYGARLDLTIPFAQGASKGNKIKIGGAISDKDREFQDDVYQIQLGNSERYMGNPSTFFGPNNTGLIGQDDRGRNVIGLFPIGFTKATKENSYTGFERIAAFYAMANYDVNEKLQVVAGFRGEQTNMFVESRDTSLAQGQIDTFDILTSLNLTYKLRENMNVRLAATQTLARPNMRELAPFVSFDFGGDFRIQGNPNLSRTLIQNYDLRWEMFPNPGEIVAASVFYKNFNNPIVTQFVPESANPLIQYVNVANASVYGVEFEFRKSLDFIGLERFRILTNFAYMQSQVDIAADELSIIEEFNPEKGTTRPFQGQSPYLINASLNYTNPDQQLEAILAFNVFGRRLAVISEGADPDIYEDPRPQLDFSISKKFQNNLGVKLSVRNILNPDVRTSMRFKDEEYLITQFRAGIDFGVNVSYSF
ncbi:MAG: TonB-dependent receptor [Bacteroidota bacterium]